MARNGGFYLLQIFVFFGWKGLIPGLRNAGVQEYSLWP